MRDEHRFVVLCSSYVWMLRELHVSGITPRIMLVTDETRAAAAERRAGESGQGARFEK